MDVRVATVAWVVLAAGCVGPGPAAPSASTPVPDAAPDVDAKERPGPPAFEEGPLAPISQRWEGHIVAGAAYELPSHFNETAGAVEPVWKTNVVVDFVRVPQDVQVSLDWNGSGLVEAMMFTMDGSDDSDAFNSYETGFTSVKHQCMRIPAEDLVEGEWDLMVHTYYGAQITFALTLTTIGGEVVLRDDAPSGGGDHDRVTRPGGEPRRSIACDAGS